MRRYMAEADPGQRDRIAIQWATNAGQRPVESPQRVGSVHLDIGGRTVALSPGKHNQLIRHIIHEFAPGFIDQPLVLCVSEAAHKLKYVHPLAENLGLVIGQHEKLPDVLLYSTSRNIVYVVEAVTSGGAIDEARITDIEKTLLGGKRPTFGLEFFTAFPDRKTFRRFVEDIAWGTQVWLAAEPFGLILFRRYR